MISVNSTVRLNMPFIRELESSAVKALEMTAEQLHTDVVQEQVIPFDTGAMQGEKTFTKAGESVTATYPNGDTVTNTITRARDGKVSIITTSPQARRLYFHPEYHFNKSENPSARGRWYEPWISGEKKDECKKVFRQFYKEESGL